MTTTNNDANGDKLTIRQLNGLYSNNFYPSYEFIFLIELFIQMDPSGRLPYHSVPPILQRFGMSLAENDLTSAAHELKYNGKINLNFSSLK